MKNILKSNGKLLYAIVVLSVMLLSLSYGIFVITSSDYKASELMVGNLLYGITIHDTDKVLQSNPVSVEAGETTLYITISSVNSIASKYTLAYNNNNVSVSASNKSGWNASGSMATYQTYAYTKTVKVVVTNNSESNQTVTFAAFGGYSYNSTSNIPLGNGYYSVANFSDVTQINGEYLTDIVEEDTNCSSSTCLYGGEATTNYFSFEEDGDLYRVLGTYTIDNNKVTKIAANTLTEVTTSSNLSTALNTIKSSIDTDNIYSTNKFNCQGTNSLTCTSSSYTDLGILSLDEYKQLEGDNANSYLYNSNSYYLLSNTSLVSNTNQNSTPSSAYIRPTMYLDSEVKVTGSGTSSEPYVLEEGGDFTLAEIMVEQTQGEKDYLSQNTIPSGNYEYNSSSSYCTVNGEISLATNVEYVDGDFIISNIQKGTKCYLYFDLLSTYQGTRVYLCPNGTYQDSSSCTSTSATRTLTRTRACNGTTTTISSCTVYCTSTSSCSTTRPTATMTMYGVFTCNGSKTGSIQSCYLTDTLCNGGSMGYPANYACTSSTASFPLDYVCNERITVTAYRALGLSGSRYPCSCGTTTTYSYSSSISDSYGTAGTCTDGYTIGTFSGTCTPSGSSGASCTSNATCSTTQTATCTATGTVKYYCSESGTYQDSQTCYY